MLRVTRYQYSLKYAHHVQLVEMRQPDWIVKKYHGSSRDYTGLPTDKVNHNTIYPRLMRTHMDLWHTDLEPSTNIQLASNATLTRYNTLLGRTSHNGNAGVHRITTYSDTELNMDQRFKGAQRNAIANLVDEPFWNTIMYPLSTLRQRSAPERDYSATKGVGLITLADLTPDGVPPSLKGNAFGAPNAKKDPSTAKAIASYQLMTLKTREHVDAYWKSLQHLITVNRPAVGDIGEAFQSRNIRHVHEAFVKFQDALRSHNFQDSYLIRHLHETRPKELTDIFGIFLEMEANYVNHDFCPRCSLPFATTRYCGEGDAHTPFRTNRGRWAPHKSWGKEWYDVVVRRAEQLWYRATEDPLFGTPSHTQKQVEELLKVYCKTKNRGKAIHFLTSLRGSLEFIQNKIKITDAMQKSVDALLDETPHPHLLTNGFRVQPNGASQYLLSSTNTTATAAQKANTLPISPMQFRIDLEMNKLRREQKEQGAIRLPPKGWKINSENIVPYKLGANGKVTNWRAVKEGIEKSFLDTGLPREAYTADELREIAYLNHHLSVRDENKAKFKAAFEAERDAARRDGLLNNRNKIVFPTADYYQVFDVSEAALSPFNQFVSEGGASSATTTGAKLKYGTQIAADRLQFQDQRNVTIALSTSTYTLDITDDVCKQYGFLHGQIVTYTDSETQTSMTAIVLGADKQSSSLIAVDRSGNPVDLGYDIENIHQKCQGITVKTGEPRRTPNVMSNLLKYNESFPSGTVIGVRDGELYVSWDNGVAVPLGTPKSMGVAKWNIHMIKNASSTTLTSSSTTNVAPQAPPAPREPYSWVTPFRNDWSEERLEELKRAPWNRERYVSLIQNKFTPVVKRFGYTQHITQDDFVTKEYRDRLISKQFFTNPQAFEVVPDIQEKSVRFGGKEEVTTRLHGLPGADRNELENGWEEVPEVTPQEVSAIEQGLRDISGKRPGNYIKSQTEIGKLKLNESWWGPLNWGWQQQQKEQSFLENAADRKSIDGSKAAFGGQFPAFGTTYGIGERIRDIAADFSKGFGLGGANNQNPLADQNEINTLGFESNNAELLGYSNVVLRLFNEKIGDQSLYNVAEQLAVIHKADPRNLLLALNEWRTAGRNPSPTLSRILSDFLRSEIETYNSSAVTGTDRIDLEGFGNRDADATTYGALAPLAPTARPGMINSSSASPWVDTDKDAFRLDYYLNQKAGGSGSGSGAEGFLMSKVVELGMRNVAATSDDALVAHCAAKLSMDFQLRLSEILGKGIPLTFQAKTQAEKKTDRQVAQAVQLIKGDELKGLLRSIGMGDGAVATIIGGLSASSDVIPLTGDFAIPLQAILTWKGPKTETAAIGSSRAAVNRPNSLSSSAQNSGVNSPSSGRISLLDAYKNSNAPITHHRFNVNPIYNLLLGYNEGAALDFAYAAHENMKNKALRNEFVEACRGVIKVPSAVASSPNAEEDENSFLNALYERYCEGLWVPTFTEATQMFLNFLKKCQADPKMLIEYFNFKGEQQSSSRGGTEVSGLNKLRFINVPFTFDNVAIESLKARQMSKRMQELPPNFVFLAPKEATPTATSSTSSDDANENKPAGKGSSAVTLKGFSKPKPSAADQTNKSQSSSNASAANAINFQNYFDIPVDERVVTAIDPNSVTALSDLLHKAFPITAVQAQRAAATTTPPPAGGAAAPPKAPPAPNATYNGPFNSFLSNPMIATKIFREWCDTVFPLLPSHWRLVEDGRKALGQTEAANKVQLEMYSNIIANESNEQLEREFRQNAERYWRRVLDGKGMENLVGGGGGRGGNNDAALEAAGGSVAREYGAATDRQSSPGSTGGFNRRVGGGGGRGGRGGGGGRAFSPNTTFNRGGGGAANAGASLQQSTATSTPMSTGGRGGSGRGGNFMSSSRGRGRGGSR